MPVPAFPDPPETILVKAGPNGSAVSLPATPPYKTDFLQRHLTELRALVAAGDPPVNTAYRVNEIGKVVAQWLSSADTGAKEDTSQLMMAFETLVDIVECSYSDVSMRRAEDILRQVHWWIEAYDERGGLL